MLVLGPAEHRSETSMVCLVGCDSGNHARWLSTIVILGNVTFLCFVELLYFDSECGRKYECGYK